MIHARLESLPDEIVLDAFGYLNATDLRSVSAASQRLRLLATDRSLEEHWHNMTKRVCVAVGLAGRRKFDWQHVFEKTRELFSRLDDPRVSSLFYGEIGREIERAKSDRHARLDEDGSTTRYDLEPALVGFFERELWDAYSYGISGGKLVWKGRLWDRLVDVPRGRANFDTVLFLVRLAGPNKLRDLAFRLYASGELTAPPRWYAQVDPNADYDSADDREMMPLVDAFASARFPSETEFREDNDVCTVDSLLRNFDWKKFEDLDYSYNRYVWKVWCNDESDMRMKWNGKVDWPRRYETEKRAMGLQDPMVGCSPQYVRDGAVSDVSMTETSCFGPTGWLNLQLLGKMVYRANTLVRLSPRLVSFFEERMWYVFCLRMEFPDIPTFTPFKYHVRYAHVGLLGEEMEAFRRGVALFMTVWRIVLAYASMKNLVVCEGKVALITCDDVLSELMGFDRGRAVKNKKCYGALARLCRPIADTRYRAEALEDSRRMLATASYYADACIRGAFRNE